MHRGFLPQSTTASTGRDICSESQGLGTFFQILHRSYSYHSLLNSSKWLLSLYSPIELNLCSVLTALRDLKMSVFVPCSIVTVYAYKAL